MNEKTDPVATFKNKEIQIRCPECGNSISVKLIQVADQESVTCSCCRKNIRLKDKDGNVRNSIKAIEQLGNSVKNININVNIKT